VTDTKHVISVSGGKDSTATLLIALARCAKDSIIPIFCDTGNEHEQTYQYLDYLEETLGVKIHRLKADFSAEILAKRKFIANDRRTGRDKQGRKLCWSNKAKRRALAVLFPTGNPFLDLCLWKGRFPSRKAQFCTEELKRNMAVEFQMALVDQGHSVISWQGVRRDESHNRRNAKLSERVGPRMRIFRPIVEWSAAQVFDYCAARGVKPNPLYTQGMGRVGCMPCINANKAELREIAARFPEHLERISQWEALVSAACKRGGSTMMTDAHDGKDRRKVFADLNIWARVEWAKTSRGGDKRQTDFFMDDAPRACASSYGLCE
jgi:3'-phosphoadenosine 5'-phosphosulfate sulfotransferase (PAPS reductase)/FAD synthetase